jgi:flagellar hook-associated protein 2
MTTPSQNISGLASGLDTNSIITQLMSIERQPQIRVNQHKALEQAREHVLTAVRDSLRSLQSALDGLRDVSTWGDVQTVDSSDTSRILAVRTAGAAAGGYDLMVTNLARAQQLTQGSSLVAASADDTLHIAVGGGTAVDVAVASGDSVQTIADKINGSSGGGVYAAVAGGKLVLSSKSTGAANTISFTSDGTLAGDLGLAETISPLDAHYTVNGGAQQSSATNTVTDAIVGVTLTLKGTTASPVSVVVGAPGPDSDLVKTKVQAFVDAYNSTVDLIHSKVDEAKVANPQTDADRAKGALEADPTLVRVLDALRDAVGQAFDGRPGAYQTLAQVGLSTGGAVGSGALNQDAIAGKLSLDGSKLSDALNADFADVKALFTNSTGSYGSEGLAQRLADVLTPFTQTGGVMDSRIQTSDAAISDYTQQASDWDVRLALKQQQLRSQFTAMESALSQAQSQGQWLSGQIAKL